MGVVQIPMINPSKIDLYQVTNPKSIENGPRKFTMDPKSSPRNQKNNPKWSPAMPGKKWAQNRNDELIQNGTLQNQN